MFADKPNPEIKKLIDKYRDDGATPVMGDHLPFTLEIITSFPDEFINPIRFYQDSCNISIAYDPPPGANIWGDWKLPRIEFVHRNPYCSKPPLPPPNPSPVPSPKMPAYCPNGVMAICATTEAFLEKHADGRFEDYKFTCKPTIAFYPVRNNEFIFPNGNLADFSLQASLTYSDIFTTRQKFGSQFVSQYQVDAFIARGGTVNGNPNDDNTVWKLEWASEAIVYMNTFTKQIGFKLFNKSIPQANIDDPRITLRTIGKEEYDQLTIHNVVVDIETSGSVSKRVNTYQLLYFCKDEHFTDPPPPPKIKPMTCCPQNDQLLRLILKRIGSLPADVPASYLTKNGVQPAQIKKVESLTEFIAWFAERFDETLGEFEITIDVDDADLTKEGKQTQTIRLPNLAESIAEMFSLMVHSNINNELILNIVNRTLIESGQIKQSEFKTFSALNALIDYMGFHTNSTTEKMPLTFKPGELSFDKVLRETEIDVSVLTYTQKETLAATMQTLLQAAAIIRAVHYRRTPGNQQQIARTIKDDLKALLGESGNLTDQVKTFITNIDKVYDGINNKPGQ